MSRIIKVVIDESRGECEYHLMLIESSKFICNDGNVLYFETPFVENELPTVVLHKLYIIKWNGDFTYVPEDSSYLCSFTDNANIKYFIYEDVSENPFVKFSKLFKWDK